MKITTTELPGVFDIEIDALVDPRGLFARTFCADEFARAGIEFVVAQANISRNDAAFTLRGMHWHDAPFAEPKVVRVIAGAAYDVVVDMRPGATKGRWLARTLDARRANALYVPDGFAHGFLTLEPHTDVFYLMGRAYTPGHARGFRWDDGAVGIEWPGVPAVVNEADCAWPALTRG